MNPGLSQELIKMNSWQFRGSIVIARRQMITIHSTMDAASTRVCHLQSDRQFYCFLVQMLDKRIITCCLVFSVIGGQVLAFLLTTHQNANELVVAALCGVAMKTGKSSALKRYEAIRLFGRWLLLVYYGRSYGSFVWLLQAVSGDLHLLCDLRGFNSSQPSISSFALPLAA